MLALVFVVSMMAAVLAIVYSAWVCLSLSLSLSVCLSVTVVVYSIIFIVLDDDDDDDDDGGGSYTSTHFKQAVREAATICPRPLQVDL